MKTGLLFFRLTGAGGSLTMRPPLAARSSSAMKARSLSIKTRIILTLVLLPMISLVAVGAIALLQNQGALSSQAERTLRRLVREKTTAYGLILSRVQEEAEAAAAYARRVYAAPLPASASRLRLLMPWNGTGYGGRRMGAEGAPGHGAAR